ncbi:unnamed protein product [Ectocarpus sp. CCAP 1310/34]|nr:unnamed protein product [Ectocarpus sp. CCAP 1310/34]
MRKDIECCYGRVKGRFRLFKAGILYKTRDSIDNPWFTACILHNMLHHYDKLDVMTEATGWQGSAGPLGGGRARCRHGGRQRQRETIPRVRRVSREARHPLLCSMDQEGGCVVSEGSGMRGVDSLQITFCLFSVLLSLSSS